MRNTGPEKATSSCLHGKRDPKTVEVTKPYHPHDAMRLCHHRCKHAPQARGFACRETQHHTTRPSRNHATPHHSTFHDDASKKRQWHPKAVSSLAQDRSQCARLSPGAPLSHQIHTTWGGRHPDLPARPTQQITPNGLIKLAILLVYHPYNVEARPYP